MKKNTKRNIFIVVFLAMIFLYLLKNISYAGLGASIADGIAGVLILPLKILMLLIGDLLQGVLDQFSSSDAPVTIANILFNKVPLLDIDFFNSTNAENTVMIIRKNVAIWYYGLRNLAAITLTIIAVYVGIRMAISTIAETKAKYKQLLIDWVTSLCLLFVLHYLMVTIIFLNNSFVDILSKAKVFKEIGNFDISQEFKESALSSLEFSTGMGSAICYVAVIIMSFTFLLTYLKRLITLAFLIIISPLVTITYSIDKMSDSTAQAWRTWFKEFTYNILIQPFHCVAFLSMGTVAVSLLQESSDGSRFKNAVFAIIVLMFIIRSAEDIVKKIFHFESQSMSSALAQTAVTATLIKTATSKFSSKSKGGNKESSGGSSGGKTVPPLPATQDDNTTENADQARRKLGEETRTQTPTTGEGTTGEETTGERTTGERTSGEGTSGEGASGEGTQVEVEEETPEATVEGTLNSINDDTENPEAADNNIEQQDAETDVDEARNALNNDQDELDKLHDNMKNVPLEDSFKKRTIKKITSAYPGIAGNIFGGAMGIAVGAATGSPEIAIGLGTQFAGMSSSGLKTLARAFDYPELVKNKKDLAKSYNKYKEKNKNLSDEEIQTNISDLYRGNKQADTKEEEALLKSMYKLRNNYVAPDSNDIEANKRADTNVMKVIDDIERGKASELNQSVRFTGDKITPNTEENEKEETPVSDEDKDEHVEKDDNGDEEK